MRALIEGSIDLETFRALWRGTYLDGTAWPKGVFANGLALAPRNAGRFWREMEARDPDDVRALFAFYRVALVRAGEGYQESDQWLSPVWPTWARAEDGSRFEASTVAGALAAAEGGFSDAAEASYAIESDRTERRRARQAVLNNEGPAVLSDDERGWR